MTYMSNGQIPWPPPPGTQYYVFPGISLVCDTVSPDTIDWWVNQFGYQIFDTPPPPGMVWVQTADPGTGSRTIRAYPEIEDGWTVLYTGSNVMVVPAYCSPAYSMGSPFGPSAFDCQVYRCLHSDGCSGCNPSMWQSCFGRGCYGSDARRVPADRDECLCYRECDRCETMHSPYSLNTARDGADGDSDSIAICDRCCRLYFSRCSHCEQYFPDEYYDEHVSDCESGCTGCDDCPDGGCDNDDTSGLIHDYGYMPYLQFRGDAAAGYYLGLELEVNTAYAHGSTYEVAQHVSEGLGDLVYLKEDSSINTGFEIVTHPMTFEYAMTSVSWRTVDELRTQYGMQETSDCGMHIHVSRTAFATASHTYRWMRFIYRNARAVQQLARRSESDYASFESQVNAWAIHFACVSKKPELGNRAYDALHDSPSNLPWYLKTPGARSRVYAAGHPYRADRYSAINVNNEQTFELRFFANTVESREVKAALGFVHASIEYTRQLTANKVVTAKGLDFASFVAWVADNNTDDHYSPLLAEIERLVP